MIENFLADVGTIFKNIAVGEYEKLGHDFLDVTLKLTAAAFTTPANSTPFKEELDQVVNFANCLAQVSFLNAQIDLLTTVTDALIQGFFQSKSQRFALLESVLGCIDCKKKLLNVTERERNHTKVEYVKQISGIVIHRGPSECWPDWPQKIPRGH